LIADVGVYFGCMESAPDVYAQFARIWTDGEPIREPHELFAAMTAAGLTPDAVTEDWLRALSKQWVYGHSDAPFNDERANRDYRRVVNG
jgi:hypothetical protein